MGVVLSFSSSFVIRLEKRVFLDRVILGQFGRTVSTNLFWETLRFKVVLKGVEIWK